jgi:hypothetical protein
MQNPNKRAERRFMVTLVRDWLACDPKVTVKEIQTKFLAMGIDLKSYTVHHYRKDALLLINREMLFGPDAQRMFRTSKSSKQ